MTRRVGIVLLLFLLSGAHAAPQGELGVLIPRSALVARIEREEAFGLLLAYGGGAESYAAGLAAGRAQVYRELLATLDGFSVP
jgi:hypothetical protein